MNAESGSQELSELLRPCHFTLTNSSPSEIRQASRASGVNTFSSTFDIAKWFCVVFLRDYRVGAGLDIPKSNKNHYSIPTDQTSRSRFFN